MIQNFELDQIAPQETGNVEKAVENNSEDMMNSTDADSDIVFNNESQSKSNLDAQSVHCNFSSLLINALSFEHDDNPRHMQDF